MQETMITDPSLRFAMSGIARAQSQTLLLMFEAMILSKASSGMSRSGPE